MVSSSTVPVRTTPPAATRWWEIVLLIGFALLFVKNGLLPGWRNVNSDFPNYYLTARLHVEGLPLDRVYEWHWFQRQKDHRQIDQPLVAYAHPPICALPFLPLARFAPLQAKRLWIVLNLGFLGAIVSLLASAASMSRVRVALVVLACAGPLSACFALGQYYVFVLLIVTVAFVLYRRNRFYAAGAVLAFAAALKIFPALLVLVFLKQRNWRALAGFVASLMACTATAVVVFGWEAHRVFFLEVLPRSLSGDMIDPYSVAWSSWTGLFHRFFLYEPMLNPHPLFNSVAIYAVAKAIPPVLALFAFWGLAKNWTEAERDWQWALVVTMSLFASTIPSSYHYVLLILPMCLAVTQLRDERRRVHLLAVISGYLLLSLVIPHFAALRGIPRLTGVTLMFIAMLAYAGSLKLNRHIVIWVGLLIAVLAGANLWSLRGRSFDNRLPMTGSSLSLSDPAISSEGIAFSIMGSRGYQLGLLKDRRTTIVPEVGDVLAVAATPRSPEVYFETVAATSAIERTSMEGTQRIAEGESPALSPDGKWLAFVRENKGRGVLWLRDLTSNSERQLTSSDYDVLEASFSAPGDMVMSARFHNGAPQIFSVDLVGSTKLLPIAGRVRYPVISLDGNHLAFSRFEGTSWHLYVRNLHSGEEKRLSGGSCNAVEPAWRDETTLIYATDCARGLGLTALALAKP